MYHSISNFLFVIGFVGVGFLYPWWNAMGGFSDEIMKVNASEMSILDNDLASVVHEKYVLSKHLPVNRNVITPKIKKEVTDLDLSARSGFILDVKSKDILYNKEADTQFSIASITKLMTALVFLDTDFDLDEYYKIQDNDRVNGGRIYLFKGDEVLIRDLLNLSLVASANTATKALVNSTGMSEVEFVGFMNKKAQVLGLDNTVFVDPVGLSGDNISTARDLAKLARAAFSNKFIAKITEKERYDLVTKLFRKERVYATNWLVNEEVSGMMIQGGKTGYTPQAGYCFVSRFSDRLGNKVISVVLGADTKQGRFDETKKMIDWVSLNFNWN